MGNKFISYFTFEDCPLIENMKFANPVYLSKLESACELGYYAEDTTNDPIWQNPSNMLSYLMVGATDYCENGCTDFKQHRSSSV